MAIGNASGKVTFLRVHDVGTGFGPPSDFLDAEVVVALAGDEKARYGFQLRHDQNLPAREGMLALLRDAFEAGRSVSIDWEAAAGAQNRRAFRVWMTN